MAAPEDQCVGLNNDQDHALIMEDPEDVFAS